MIEVILRERCRLEEGKPLLLGISGGPDSLCLLGLLQEREYPLVVAHFNHKLRPEADQEAEAVQDRARKMGLRIIIDSANVRAWAEEQGYSIEEASRIQRYRFLFKSARSVGAQAVVVGHTADDQVETVLMHFLRGAGLAGLKGMPYRLILPVFDDSIPLVRPLLHLWREDTEAYCLEHGMVPHLDSSNLDETYFRNHLRHSVIPELEKYNPRFKKALLRTTLALQGDYDILQGLVDEKWAQVISGMGEGWIAFHTDKLALCEPPMQRSLLRRAGETLRPGNRDIGYDVLERASNFLHEVGNRRMDFINGLYLIHQDGKVILAAYEADLTSDDQFQWSGEITLKVGEEKLIGKNWLLTSSVIDVEEDGWEKNDDPWSAFLDLEKTGNSFTIRTRKSGDEFLPLGMGGQSVKVREFFINQKIPRRFRYSWPVIVAGDEIAWIPGFRISHTFRVTGKTRSLVHLTIKKLPADD